MMTHLRVIPSIEQLRQREAIRRLEAQYGRDASVRALREETDVLRHIIRESPEKVTGTDDAARHIEEAAATRLRTTLIPSLRPLINATGVIVHTNLGRAPLPAAAVRRISEVALGYSNLEYDIAQGTRGSRAVHAAALLTRLTGAEAAVIVNNNAAAVLLVLTALSAGREVIISRGELVEIGGGFRIPDVMRQSGASLREVGTTNRTRVADYTAVISDRTALILRVHPSNFRIEGFTKRPTLAQLVEVGGRFNVPVVEDLGSGNLYEPPVVGEEPTVRASVETGVTLCTFSGDKLLGGPQAGIIVGARTYLDRVRSHPLWRALRVDKLTYAALEGTLLEHATGRANRTVPVARMITTSVDALNERARRIVRRLESCVALKLTVQAGTSVIGGGSTPGLTLATRTLSVEMDGHSVSTLDTKLRAATPAVVGRIEDDRLLLDLRTVSPEQDDELVALLKRVATV